MQIPNIDFVYAIRQSRSFVSCNVTHVFIRITRECLNPNLPGNTAWGVTRFGLKALNHFVPVQIDQVFECRDVKTGGLLK